MKFAPYLPLIEYWQMELFSGIVLIKDVCTYTLMYKPISSSDGNSSAGEGLLSYPNLTGF